MESVRKAAILDPTRKAMSLVDEFKNFAFKGNVIDLAVGVIIGAAFGKIVDSLVKNIVMPILSLVIPGGQAYTAWKFTIGGKDIPYGLFLAEFVNFMVVAFALYLFIVKFLKVVMKSRTAEAAAPPPPPPADVVLLTEIRDLLKARA